VIKWIKRSPAHFESCKWPYAIRYGAERRALGHLTEFLQALRQLRASSIFENSIFVLSTSENGIFFDMA
jgi:hypothetical protein